MNSKKLLRAALAGAFLLIATVAIVGFTSDKVQTSEKTSQTESFVTDHSGNADMDLVGSKCGEDDNSKSNMKKSKEEKCGGDDKEVKAKDAKCGGDDKEMKAKDAKCGGDDHEKKSKDGKEGKNEKCGTGKCG